MKLFPETVLTTEAKRSRWRHVWIIDLLIALAIFVAAQMIESILLTPAMMIWMITSLDFSSLSSGDPLVFAETLTNFLNEQPDWMMLLMLFATVVVIVLCIIYCTKLERRPIQSLGFRGKTPVLEYLIGYGVGIGMFCGAWGICLLNGTATIESISSNVPRTLLTLLPFFLGFMVQGMSEEVLCRGFLQQTLSARYNGFVAVGINALLFAALHLLNTGISLLALLNLFLFGVFASFYLWKRGNIWGVAALHAAWNFTQGNLLGIDVSGNAFGPSLLHTTLESDSSIWNGGAFGLEGGLAVTIILALGILVFALLPVRKEARL